MQKTKSGVQNWWGIEKFSIDKKYLYVSLSSQMCSLESILFKKSNVYTNF